MLNFAGEHLVDFVLGELGFKLNSEHRVLGVL